MSMKISMIILLGITLLFSSCKDENSSENDSDIESVSEENINSDSRENIKAEPGTYTKPKQSLILIIHQNHQTLQKLPNHPRLKI